MYYLRPILTKFKSIVFTRFFQASRWVLTMPVSQFIANRINQSEDGCLDLESCGVTDENLPDIVTMIKEKKTITNLNLRCNFILAENSAVLIAFLPLTHLNIAWTYLSDKTFIKLLESNQTLISIDISDNGYTDEVYNAILQNNRLIHVDYRINNSVSEEMQQKVEAHLEANLLKWKKDNGIPVSEDKQSDECKKNQAKLKQIWKEALHELDKTLHSHERIPSLKKSQTVRKLFKPLKVEPNETVSKDSTDPVITQSSQTPSP